MKIDNALPPIEYTETKKKRLADKVYAPMDAKTQRIRDRLAKRLNQVDQKFTDAALEKTKKSIQSWLERHQKERTSLKETSAKHFFSNGEKVAPLSKQIERIRQRLEKDIVVKTAPRSLQGRVKTS